MHFLVTTDPAPNGAYNSVFVSFSVDAEDYGDANAKATEELRLYVGWLTKTAVTDSDYGFRIASIEAGTFEVLRGVRNVEKGLSALLVKSAVPKGPDLYWWIKDCDTRGTYIGCANRRGGFLTEAEAVHEALEGNPVDVSINPFVPSWENQDDQT